MVKLNTSLKAFTVIESIVAMVVIVICFGISSMVFYNILEGDSQRNLLKAAAILNKEAFAIKEQKNYLDEEREEGDWLLSKKTELYEGTENLYRLTLILSDKKGNTIMERAELIITEE